MELPKTKRTATRQDPTSIVIYSKPKMGKTTILAGLDDCLVIDLEKGSYFVDILVFDVLQKAEEEGKLPVVILKRLINKIKEENQKINGKVYKYIAVDTVTALEDIVLPLANKMYKDTPMGKNWVGDDVTTLPNGAGYRYTRLALSTILNELKELCDTFIILGHVKDKNVEKDGKEMNERSLDLTGKSSSILCSQVDAIGYLFRDENKTIIDFESNESLLCGARSPHLKGQKIQVAESDEEGNLNIDWSGIFIDKK
jgi:hypothetical protein